MSAFLRSAVAALALAGAVSFAPGVGAQQQNDIDNNFKYNSGQDIQPIFEGWSKAPDGSFNMHFGYLNRNWVQKISIPVGPNNNIEPGGPDKGQPTFFTVRTNRNLFTVNVPKDWGKKELIWTVVANGKTQKAYAWLQPEWEIDPAGGAATGGQTTPELMKNKGPDLTLSGANSIGVGQPLKLSAAYTDDGIPKPSLIKKPAVGQETPPTLVSSLDAPVNLPDLAPGRPGSGAGGAGGTGVRGPNVSWRIYRGPADAEFTSGTTPLKLDGTNAVTSGSLENTVTFTQPGEYIIRVRANDRHLFVDKDYKVTVTGSTQQ